MSGLSVCFVSTAGLQDMVQCGNVVQGVVRYGVYEAAAACNVMSGTSASVSAAHDLSWSVLTLV